MADPSSAAALGFVATWFTPTSLFLLLNLVIATIFLTSRFTKHHHDDHDHNRHDSAPIARAPSSLIDRVKSINFSLYKFDHHPLQPESYYQQHYSESEHSHHVDPPPLARAPSVLERFKSMNFWHQEPEQLPHPENSTRADSPPPSLLHRLKSINVSSYWNDKTDPVPEPVTRAHFEPPPLARQPSFLARVKSINFSLYGPENSYPEETDPVDEAADHHVMRMNSDSKSPGKKLPAKMKKSASDKSAFGHFGQEEEDEVAAMRRPATVRERKKKKGVAAEKEAEEIDTKADDFINKFRQQLQLQRLDSIMRYKELITRTHENHQ